MKKSVVTLILFLGISCFFQTTFAQNSENQENCEHFIRYHHPTKLLSYLFNKYGKEVSENILMNMKVYEAENNVKVLFSSDFALMMEKFELRITNTTDSDEINYLNQRKTQFVQFETIEENLL